MPPAEDELPSRWRWLDWWFAPPWRALLTWLVLVGLTSQWVNYSGGLHKITGMIDAIIGQLNRVSPTPLPVIVKVVAWRVNFWLPFLWFEPFALRLNLPRGVAWLALRLFPIFVVGVLTLSPYYQPWMWWPCTFLSYLAGYVVLRGWRSRPWMCAVGAILACGIGWLFTDVDTYLPYAAVWRELAWAAPYAIPLLYCTRLLTPEERTRD